MSQNSPKQNLNQLLDWLATNKNVKAVTREGSKIKFTSPQFKKRNK